MERRQGRLILFNGASSTGKTTLCRALQARLAEPFWHYSIDHFRGRVLPWERIERGEFAWPSLRPAYIDGFHRCLPALAQAGNDLIVDHIVETAAWMSDLVRLLEQFDVYFVGVHCPLAELERRERARGDRRAGEARNDFETVHAHCTYDLEVDGTRAVGENVDVVVSAWLARRRPGAFERMRAEQRHRMQNAG
jgi:chloramphenicol 3-O phosphotransferase